MGQFMEFLEHDAVRRMYGIPDLKEPIKDNPEGGPIKFFGREKLFSELSNYKVGPLSGKRLLSEVRWGDGVGAVRATLSPNFLVMVERLTNDLKGHPVWICKKVSKIKIMEYAGQEFTVAGDIAKQVDFISRQQIDPPKEHFNMDAVIRRTVDKLKRLPGPFVYESVKHSGKDWKTIKMGITSAGNGQLVRQTNPGITPAALLEIAFIRDKGLVKSIFTTVAQDGNSGAWEIQAPYFFGMFSPNQSPEELSSILFSAVRLV